MSGSWILCEKSGRWAAAVRTAMARLAAERPKPRIPRRIREVRSLDEFRSATNEGQHQLGLVEVRLENLPAILELLSSQSRLRTPIAALLDETLRSNSEIDGRPPTPYRFSADVLREAGALAVIDSPRRISELLALTDALAAASSRLSPAAGEQTSLAEWAWAALPWQDA